LNHWDLALEAHNANFPDADHDLHDVQDVHPRRFRRTDLLWASPECTHHAYCRGPRSYDPEAQRSRVTFSDVVRFTDFHRYDVVMVENVIEARLWCEAASRKHGWDEQRQEYRCSCGADFDEWYAEMIELGYEGRVLMFNSQFALPTPQSRDRMYVIFWRKGLREPQLDFRPQSWCSSCEKVVRGVTAWKPASKGSVRDRVVFEWGRYGANYVYRCPDCQDVVSPAVVGAKQILDWSLPMHRIGDRPKAEKTRERIKHGLTRLQTTRPVAVQVGGNLFERRPGVRIWSMDDPFRTVVGTSQHALVVPDEAAIFRYGGQTSSPRAIGEPMSTVTAHDREVGVIVPNRENATGAVLEEPAATVTTAPSQHMLVQVNRGTATDRLGSTLDEPTRTIAGHGELAMVTLRRNADLDSADAPAAALTGGGNHHALLVYNGVPGHVRTLDEGCGVVKGRDSHSLLVPYYSTGVARTTHEPSGTVTSKDREALVVSHERPPLVVTDDDVDDCLFRMLQWHELLRAQAPFDHPDGRAYELTARRRQPNGKMRELSNEQRVKMIGNMVSSPVATLLGLAVAESLAA
jgi:DNA (cytosine-5)-methyltransferase 1